MNAIWGVCLVLAAGSAPIFENPNAVFIATQRFTLAWTHSIEKQRWEEDYAVLPPTEPGAAPRLLALAARIKGSGAGMEPPADARLQGGWYHYRPSHWPQTPLRLTRSEFTADFDFCPEGACQPLHHWLASDGAVTLLAPCAAPATARLKRAR